MIEGELPAVWATHRRRYTAVFLRHLAVGARCRLCTPVRSRFARRHTLPIGGEAALRLHVISPTGSARLTDKPGVVGVTSNAPLGGGDHAVAIVEVWVLVQLNVGKGYKPGEGGGEGTRKKKGFRSEALSFVL